MFSCLVYGQIWVNTYLWRKVVCFLLFCSYEIHWTQDASDRVLGVFGVLSMRRSAWAWFHDVCTCSAKVREYWMIFSLKIILNHNWKSLRNWNVPLALLERSWWAGFNGIYLVWFGFTMWEILILKWFLLLEIQINSQKTDFGRKNQFEDLVTLGPMAQATLVFVNDR